MELACNLKKLFAISFVWLKCNNRLIPSTDTLCKCLDRISDISTKIKEYFVRSQRDNFRIKILSINIITDSLNQGTIAAHLILQEVTIDLARFLICQHRINCFDFLFMVGKIRRIIKPVLPEVEIWLHDTRGTRFVDGKQALLEAIGTVGRYNDLSPPADK